jgi:iron(III) transport system permease protein
VARGDYWFPDVRSLGGAAFVLAFVLYPYVYLLARTAFLEQSSATLESARMLGHGPWRSFFRIALPLARPGIAAGTALCLMETLADYGTVAYFGVNTFSTGSSARGFRSAIRSPPQLGALLLAGIVAVIALERMARGSAAFHASGGSARHDSTRCAGRRRSARGLRARFRCARVPAARGAAGASRAAGRENHADRALRAARVEQLHARRARCADRSCLCAHCQLRARMRPGLVARVASRIAGAGYAIPGVVVAVGVMAPLTQVDQWIGAGKLLLSGTIIALLYAYLVRFLASRCRAWKQGSRGSAQHGRRGTQPRRRLAGNACPRASAAARAQPDRSGVLVFVDVMKELPATLALRPFDFDTLAVQTFNLAKDERLAEASIPALAIVAVGLIPVFLLARRLARED